MNNRMQNNSRLFHGSYAPNDCVFLLKKIDPHYVTIADKEKLIQSGKLHYSQVIHEEKAPSVKYLNLFYELTDKYKIQLAGEVVTLADKIVKHKSDNIVLVSLARAGTPIGVLLKRAIEKIYKKNVFHYSISIIRDRGIDENALDFILSEGHQPNNIVFVDGWTAKGVISNELKKAINKYNSQRNINVPYQLYVISDIGGTANVCATFEDYAIPSSLLNSTVSGLVSRSILNDMIDKNDFHGCVYYSHLQNHDLSNWFIDQISKNFHELKVSTSTAISSKTRYEKTQKFLNFISNKYHVSDINRIKPGIAEATRVLLRRVPDLLILRNIGCSDSLHLEQLAEEKNVDIVEMNDMPFGACSIIKDVIN